MPVTSSGQIGLIADIAAEFTDFGWIWILPASNGHIPLDSIQEETCKSDAGVWCFFRYCSARSFNLVTSDSEGRSKQDRSGVQGRGFGG